MLRELTEDVLETIKSAARKATGYKRRQFQAEMALKYCQGSPRRTERVFGWGRDAVNTGLNELRTGIRCHDNFTARGRHKTEEEHPEITKQIHSFVEPATQADPKFQTPFAYTRMTAKAVQQQLEAMAQPGEDGTPPPIPSERSVYRILNRLTVTAEEFIRRFLQHVLPSGFQKVRHFGFAHARQRIDREWLKMLVTVTLNFVYVLLVAAKPLPVAHPPTCPDCGAEMTYIGFLPAPVARLDSS